MQQIMQLAAAERKILGALEAAKRQVDQIGTDEVDQAAEALTVSCVAARCRLLDRLARIGGDLDGLVVEIRRMAGDVQEGCHAADMVRAMPAAPAASPDAPTTPPLATVEVEVDSTTVCPGCGPFVEIEELTPTARRCRACGRQWATVIAGDDTIDIGWDGTTPHPDLDHAAEEPGQVVVPVNRVGTATTTRPTTTSKPSTNGRRRK